ncbi:MAG: transcription antitermination factor NusB [Erysipelotrichaceae bacterium]|nr:transcription antitermination factor NusB [Erysipelotrichaceae bacterium]
MLNRHETREKIVFTLYQHLLLKKDIDVCYKDNFEEENDFAEKITYNLIDNKPSYIKEISSYLDKWSFDRLNLVDQAILLEAVSELKLGLNDKNVVIDEAINLTKTYCDEDSYRYINGVLDNICRNSQ